MAEKISNILHSWCTEAIASIPLTDLDKFEYSHDNVETVKLLYPLTHKIIPTSSPASGKNITVAEAQKVKGNEFYGKKDLKNALAAYNEGIIVCPQDTGNYFDSPFLCFLFWIREVLSLVICVAID